MGGEASKAETKEKPKKKCCASPETKRARDECVVTHGADEDGACRE